MWFVVIVTTVCVCTHVCTRTRMCMSVCIFCFDIFRIIGLLFSLLFIFVLFLRQREKDKGERTSSWVGGEEGKILEALEEREHHRNTLPEKMN